MTRSILPLALGLAAFLAPTAQARQTAALDSLQIDLWPEFDRPAVLVIVAGRLRPSLPYPVEITLNIPAASGGPHAVAVQDEAGNLFDAPYTTAAAGDLLAVTVQVDRPDFHLEYYDPALAVDGENRAYQFQWTAPGPVGAATLRVQQPAGAEGLTSDLALAEAGAGEFGLNYLAAPLGQLAAGQVVSARLEYTKSVPGLSAEQLGVSQPAAPAAQPVAAVPAGWPVGPVAAGAAGALALVAAVFFIFRNRPAAQPAFNRTRRGRRRGRRMEGAAAAMPAQPGPAADLARYCTQCGQPGLAGDQFCRNCGARLRR